MFFHECDADALNHGIQRRFSGKIAVAVRHVDESGYHHTRLMYLPVLDGADYACQTRDVFGYFSLLRRSDLHLGRCATLGCLLVITVIRSEEDT